MLIQRNNDKELELPTSIIMKWIVLIMFLIGYFKSLIFASTRLTCLFGQSLWVQETHFYDFNLENLMSITKLYFNDFDFGGIEGPLPLHCRCASSWYILQYTDYWPAFSKNGIDKKIYLSSFGLLTFEDSTSIVCRHYHSWEVLFNHENCENLCVIASMMISWVIV